MNSNSIRIVTEEYTNTLEEHKCKNVKTTIVFHWMSALSFANYFNFK